MTRTTDIGRWSVLAGPLWKYLQRSLGPTFVETVLTLRRTIYIIAHLRRGIVPQPVSKLRVFPLTTVGTPQSASLRSTNCHHVTTICLFMTTSMSIPCTAMCVFVFSDYFCSPTVQYEICENMLKYVIQITEACSQHHSGNTRRSLGPTLLSLFRFYVRSSRNDLDYRHGSLERARRTTLEILTTWDNTYPKYSDKLTE